MNPEIPFHVVPGLPTIPIVIWLICYLFFAYCIARMAVKLGMPLGKSFILSIIPIANLYLWCKMGNKPWWWLLLCFIPFAGVVFIILIWVNILRNMGKPGWWVILWFIPIVNIVILCILAFGKHELPTA